MNPTELPPGRAVAAAHRLIIDHATGAECAGCQDDWCPGAEWALHLVVMDDVPPDAGRAPVTAVARRVAEAHTPRPVDGCRPCGLPTCDRYTVATYWLELVGEAVEPIYPNPLVDELHGTERAG